MLTRSQLKTLTANEGPMKCRCCQRFYGDANSMFLCSSCARTDVSPTKSSKTLALHSMRRCGVKFLPSDRVRAFVFAIKTEFSGVQTNSGVEASTKLAKVYFSCVCSLRHNFLLDQATANEISSFLYEKLGHLPHYHVISQTLACLTFQPWTIDTRASGWAPSVVCYYGNMGETPKDNATYDRLTKQCIHLPFGSKHYNPLPRALTWGAFYQ